MKKILFVCHGNICRSAMAEMIMRQMVSEAGLDTEVLIDSCATSTEEIGNDIYPPARRCLQTHGVPVLPHAARQITRDDYARFDLILCMENYNIRNLHPVLGGQLMQKIRLSLHLRFSGFFRAMLPTRGTQAISKPPTAI